MNKPTFPAVLGAVILVMLWLWIVAGVRYEHLEDDSWSLSFYGHALVAGCDVGGLCD